MIKIENLSHTYQNRGIEALKNINLEIQKGESLVIVGSSGSGKSTLLKAINRLVEPSSGRIFINGEDILHSPLEKVYQIRGKIGMIFQNFNLIERESVAQNVLNGRLRYNTNFNTIFSRFSPEDYSVARESLSMVNLADFKKERVTDLSGGQKQRVAIARALSQNPEIILADEPVSSLDPKLMKEIMDLLTNICRKKGITLVTSLHFLDFAKRYGTSIIGMRNGEIVFNGCSADLTEKDLINIYGETEDWHLYGKTGF
ncbi:MAG: phosphonate ABC transporter ATP-binding protein [Candidatus Nealsonbacteria bacterium RIFCSPLOWO2_01_FULL_43_32]|uniref:Phosphonate ABC transporter ATP-binding protein n=1 Tax=Candidatus Nealsonbacteria bacterium RIFCSPLOWO2_01_FULL_43_32 TaxID=1801672 RepID=A0A1G2EDU5_9BACT|nr:MAG: phosphonate ABC transporter ATP-binding protein [Candidatus Nealsonbacteria bacterium RIFCSPLOWO2_01_FULL_43_32]